MTTITHVAIVLDGTTHSLPAPNRHHHVIRVIKNLGILKQARGIQGFLTEDGVFVDRETAAKIAMQAGQVTKLIDQPELCSEDLW